jgi:hypothetical protein
MAQPAIAQWTKREVFPGPAARTKAEIGRYVRDNAITYHHQVGTMAPTNMIGERAADLIAAAISPSAGAARAVV